MTGVDNSRFTSQPYQPFEPGKPVDFSFSRFHRCVWEQPPDRDHRNSAWFPVFQDATNPSGANEPDFRLASTKVALAQTVRVANRIFDDWQIAYGNLTPSDFPGRSGMVDIITTLRGPYDDARAAVRNRNSWDDVNKKFHDLHTQLFRLHGTVPGRRPEPLLITPRYVRRECGALAVKEDVVHRRLFACTDLEYQVKGMAWEFMRHVWENGLTESPSRGGSRADETRVAMRHLDAVAALCAG
jgi:hypothetical protein